MKWKATSLGEVMRHRKGNITINDATTYKLCRVQVHRRGVVLRQELAGAAISTKKQQVCKAGDFLVAEMDAKVGGYGFVPPELEGAIVSSHYYLFEVNTRKLHPPYLEVVSQAEILQQQIVAKGSTNYSSIRPGSVLEWQIPLPEDIEVQKRIAQSFQAIQKKLAIVCEEITHQETLLAKLQQAIFQEAIQGKLTADWRAAHPQVEPASQLLHRLQSEKSRLISAKQLRPEKPLPKITPAEIPFAIPKTWDWCRFGSYARFERGKFSARPRNDSRFFSGPYPFIQIGSLDLHGSVITTSTQTLNEEGLAVSRMFEAGTIAVAIVGGTIGNLGVLGRDMCFTDSIVGVRPSKLTCQDFILLLMRCKQPEIQAVAYQRSGQPNISLPNLTDILIPLPPLAEQAAIVARVEAMLGSNRLLAGEIAHTRTHAAHLLQAVLKEAFSPTVLQAQH